MIDTMQGNREQDIWDALQEAKLILPEPGCKNKQPCLLPDSEPAATEEDEEQGEKEFELLSDTEFELHSIYQIQSMNSYSIKENFDLHFVEIYFLLIIILPSQVLLIDR